MNITVHSKEITGVWPRVEGWQNSTLRYSPPPDFPRYLAGQVGRAALMRCWITLDEYWDLKTNEFYPDFNIGVNRCDVSELHYPYDWKNIVPAPSGTRFVDYLTTHAEAADEIMLNVRRLEREVSDGIITYEKYEEIFSLAVEYCKELAPNIRYIECCNEVELGSFGKLTVEEYYRIYRCACRAVRRLNEKHNYPLPLELGGYAKASTLGNFERWVSFLEQLAADDSPDRMVDFYSVHVYDMGLTRVIGKQNPAALTMSAAERLKLFLYMHNREVRRLGLPQRPVFVDEIGFTRTTGVLTDSLKNAAGTLSMLIAGADTPDMYLFPWCTFHNPRLQISFTQFLLLDDGSYAPTPNGNAVIMLHRLAENRLAMECDADCCAAATGGGGRITVICTNPTDKTDEFRAVIRELDAGCVRVTEYLCDSYRNNRVTGEDARELHATRTLTLPVSDGTVELRATAEPYAFLLWEIEAAEPAEI